MDNREGLIKVGKKPFMTYLRVAQLQFKKTDKIKIVARGINICRAVDLSEVLCKKLIRGAVVDKIILDSEAVDDHKRKGQKINISSIEITLIKSKDL